MSICSIACSKPTLGRATVSRNGYRFTATRSIGVMPCCASAARSPAFPRRARAARHHADRKSTRLNSSHLVISYAVFCLKKKKKVPHHPSLVHRKAVSSLAVYRHHVVFLRLLLLLRHSTNTHFLVATLHTSVSSLAQHDD